MSIHREVRTTTDPVTREDLYALVWAEPMLKVAARFSVSSSYLARICTLLNVPRPERGYWAKLVVGKAPPIPSLPDARPGDEIAWTRDGTSFPSRPPKPLSPRRRERPKHERTVALSDEHGLIAGAAVHFEAGRLSSEIGYLKPYKRLLVDLIVTQASLAKALSFANELFLAFEVDGYRVVLAPSGEHLHRETPEPRENPKAHAGYNEIWSPARPTVVYIGTVAIGLTIMEMSESVTARYVGDGKFIRDSDFTPPMKRGRYAADNTWTTEKSFPTSRLCLQAYSPYPATEWTKQFRQGKNSDLSTQIPSIVRDLKKAASEIVRLTEIAEQEAEKERQRWAAMQEAWRREEAEKRAAKALKDSKDDLASIIESWARTKRIEEFFSAVESAVSRLPAEQQAAVAWRLDQGRRLIGGPDPLGRFANWKSPEERLAEEPPKRW